MKGFIVVVIVAAIAQVALSASCGCYKPKSWCADSGNSNGQLLSEELIDVDQLHGNNWNSGSSLSCSRPQTTCNSQQNFVMRTPEVNVYPNIKHCASNIDFAPTVYTKQRCAQLQVKPIVVKVEKTIQPRRKMVCRYIDLPNHQHDSSCGYGGYESGSEWIQGSGNSHGSSCGCGCNK